MRKSHEIIQPNEFRSFREHMVSEVVHRIPLQKLHSEPREKWEEGGWTTKPAQDAADILLASLGNPELSSIIHNKLFTPNENGDLRMDRVADIYMAAVDKVNNRRFKTDREKKLLRSALEEVPFDQFPTKQALTLAAEIAYTYKKDAPDLAFHYNPLEFLSDAFSTDPDTMNPEFLGQILSTHKYYESEEQNTKVLETVAKWAMDPEGGKKKIELGPRMKAYGLELYLGEILQGLSDRLELQSEFIQSLWGKGVKLAFLPGYISGSFDHDSPDAESLYQLVLHNKPQYLTSEAQNSIGPKRAWKFVKQGNVDSALAALANVAYADGAHVRIGIAREIFNQGNKQEGLRMLHDIYEEPVVVEANGKQTDLEVVKPTSYAEKEHVLERVAVEALHMGDISLALTSYDHSRAYPTLKEELAKIAVSSGQIKEYLTHLAEDTDIHLYSRLVLATEGLKYATRQWGLDKTKQEELHELRKIVEPLIHEGLQKDHEEKPFEMLAFSGNVDEVLKAVDPTQKNSIVDEVVFALSYIGNTEKAWEVFSTHPSMPDDSLSKEESLAEMLRSAVLTENYDLAKKISGAMQEHHVARDILKIYKEYGDTLNANRLPEWLKESLFGGRGITLFDCARVCEMPYSWS